jgi:hypothetical protein
MGGIDITWLVGLVVTAVAYVPLSRSLDKATELHAESISDQRLSHGRQWT